MSITYPEVQPAAASLRAGQPAADVMNTGSALFPNGAAKVYERAAKARSGRTAPLAWIAAPVAVVLIGGAVYLSATHQPAAQRAMAPVPPAQTVSSTTTRTALAVTAPAAPVVVAAPGVAERHVVTHTRVTQAPAARPERHVARTSVTRRQIVPTAPAPMAPVMAAPAQAVVPAPTPGTFAFTSAPASAASDSAQPMSQSDAPGTVLAPSSAPTAPQ